MPARQYKLLNLLPFNVLWLVAALLYTSFLYSTDLVDTAFHLTADLPDAHVIATYSCYLAASVLGCAVQVSVTVTVRLDTRTGLSLSICVHISGILCQLSQALSVRYYLECFEESSQSVVLLEQSASHLSRTPHVHLVVFHLLRLLICHTDGDSDFVNHYHELDSRL